MTVTTPPASAEQIDITCPADGRRVDSVPVHSRAEVEAKAHRLREAQPAWQALAPRERGRQILNWLGWILDHEDHLLKLLQSESGKSWGDVQLEMAATAQMLNYYGKSGPRYLRDRKLRPQGVANASKRLRELYEPYPLVGVITPWNYPLAMPMMDVPAALVAGAAVLSKPSEVTPLCWNECVRGWREVGNVDVLDGVTGLKDTGEAVVDAVDMVMFTGSTAVGRQIGIRAAERLIPACLELGGKDPMIVLADADLDRAAAGAAWGGLANAGQTCIAVERVYVDRKVHDDFVQRLVDQVSSLRQGMDRPNSYEADFGAMATPNQRTLVRDQVAEAVERGAKVAYAGSAPDAPEDALFQPPTILTGVDHSMRVMREETFGPLLAVMAVDSEQQAVELANDSEYGLTASVWSSDPAAAERVARALQTGAVNVNNVMANIFQFGLPFGGWKHSGIGARFGGADGVLKYCRTKALVEERVHVKAEAYWYPHQKLSNRFQRRVIRLLTAPGWRRKLIG